MKHFYGIFLFSKITKNRYCHFQVCSNDAVTERSIPPNFGACCAILEKSIYYVEFLVPEAIAQICFVNKVFCKISKRAFFLEDLRWLLLWFISITSIVVTWVSWFSGQKFKLEAENFIFHILHKNVRNFSVKILALWSAKNFRLFHFSLCHSQLVYTWSNYEVVQSLAKAFLKQIFFSLFYSQVVYNCSNESTKQHKHSNYSKFSCK